MCFPSFSYPRGIPISVETHKKYPQNVQRAWDVFDAWWKDESTSKSWVAMPAPVKTAMDLILETPIPDQGGATGEASCYMVSVLDELGEQ